MNGMPKPVSAARFCQPSINRCQRNESSDLSVCTIRPARRATGAAAEEGKKMKKFGFAAVIASGLTAAVIGLAGPAQAELVHYQWLDEIQPQVSVPHVDTTVHQSR
jgi:hypothetical protein